MNNSKKLLKSIVGDQGYETLEKAIFKRRTASVIDPLEYYLPLMVVPRTLLSWLVQTIKPMKIGEIKTAKFPGKDDITINFQKDDIDQFRGEFIQGGKVIHTFEKQSLPSVSAHLMTVGEEYESFTDEKPAKLKSGDEGYTEQFSNDLKEKLGQRDEPKMDMMSSIMSINDIKPEGPKDAEAIKWEMSHANVRELTSVIGKLVDALTAKEIARKEIDEDLDKMSVKETDGAEQKIEESQTPADIIDDKNKDLKSADLTQVAGTGRLFRRSDLQRQKPEPQPEVPEQKTVQSGEQAAEAAIKKDAMQETVCDSKSYFRKKINKVMQKGEMPKGAGRPIEPAKPKEPKPPVPASNAPAQAAAKQAQASARGSYAPPKTPGTQQPPNPTVKPKTAKPEVTQAAKPAKMGKSDEYFKKRLSKVEVKKSQTCSVTENELYKSECAHCHVPEFKKSEDGTPEFNPCACFKVLRKTDEGKEYKFVSIFKKSEGSYDLKFHPEADSQSVKVFLLTLKARLLMKRKFDL